MFNRMKELVADASEDWEFRKLKKRINSILELAKGYENEGVASGSRQYQLLYEQASAAIDTFCEKNIRSIEEIKLNMPGLLHLHALTGSAPEKKATSLGFWVAAGIALATVGGLVTCMFAAYHNLYHFLTVK